MDIEILHPERLACWCNRLQFPEAVINDLKGLAEQIQSNPLLIEKFTSLYAKTSLRGEWHREWTPLPMDPDVEAVLGEATVRFYFLAYLAALPIAHQEYLRRGISEAIFDATMADIRFWLCQDFSENGTWRFDQFNWIWRHLSCELFRLGRLQYMLIPFDSGVTAFRHRPSQRILLLADPELPLRADGYAFEAGKFPPEFKHLMPEKKADIPWRPEFREEPDGWFGNPVSPYGFVLRQPRFLHRTEWELALHRGDTVLDIHIPRGDPFHPEAIRESLQQAQTFFAGQYPHKPYKALFCHTWFFTPQLQQILPPTSNIVRFQREFYLYPHDGGPGFLWSFVFGEKNTDLASVPRDTSLRRAVMDWLAEGKELFDLPGVAFHGPQTWGEQPYMRQWDGSHPDV